MTKVLVALLVLALVVVVVRAVRRRGSVDAVAERTARAGKRAAEQAQIARQGQSGLGGGLGPM